jgi:hypothetical protein
MTDLQKAELVMILQAFKENLSGKHSDSLRIVLCEEAIVEILKTLTTVDDTHEGDKP